MGQIFDGSESEKQEWVIVVDQGGLSYFGILVELGPTLENGLRRVVLTSANTYHASVNLDGGQIKAQRIALPIDLLLGADKVDVLVLRIIYLSDAAQIRELLADAERLKRDARAKMTGIEVVSGLPKQRMM